jgi:hypothetical protein
MNKWGVCLPVIILFAYLLQGCTVKQTVYLQDVRVDGPVNQPPLHLISGDENNILTLSPKIYINTTKQVNGKVDGHSKVNKNGVYQLDTAFGNSGKFILKESGENKYDFTGNNLYWNMPDVLAGMDFDLKLTRVFSFFGSFNYSHIDQQDLFSGAAGFGINSRKPHYGSRFDFGVMWHNLNNEISSAVVTTTSPLFGSSEQSVMLYQDHGKASAYNFFANWTLNSINSSLPFDYYFGLGVFGQTIYDYTPSQTDMGDYLSNVLASPEPMKETAVYLMLMLGVYENIGDNNRISCGVRLIKETQIENLSKSTFLFPTVQWDMSF